MAIKKYVSPYKGPALVTPTSGLCKFSLPACEIKEIQIVFDQPIVGDGLFNVTLEGADLFSGANRPEIASGGSSVTKSGLSIAVADQEFTALDILTLPTSFVYPFVLIVIIDDLLGTDVYQEYVDSQDAEVLIDAKAHTDNEVFVLAGTVDDLLDLKEDLANKDTDNTLAADSDENYPSQKAVKKFVEDSIALINNGGGQTVGATGIISGGTYTWEGGLNYKVVATVYRINGVTYTIPETIVTLEPADGSDPRQDLLILDDTPQATKITGTPATPAVEPSYDSTSQIRLGSAISIPASATEPEGVASETIYDEDDDWTSSSLGSGVNNASTSLPISGSKSIQFTGASNGAYSQLTRGAPTDLTDFNTVSFKMKADSSFGNNKYVKCEWLLAGVVKGNALIVAQNGISSYGFDGSNTTDTQLIAIPLNRFLIPAGQTVDQLRIFTAGSGLSFKIDEILLSNTGSIVVSSTSGVTEEQLTTLLSTKADLVGGKVSPSQLPSETELVKTTGSLEDGEIEVGTLAVGKRAMISITSADKACRVRLYPTASARTADASRPLGTAVAEGDDEPLLEDSFTASKLTIQSTAAMVYNGDSPTRNSYVYYAIQNLSGLTETVEVTFNILILEA